MSGSDGYRSPSFPAMARKTHYPIVRVASTPIRRCVVGGRLLSYYYERTIKQSRRFVLQRKLSRLWREFDALTFFNRVMDLFFKLLIFFVVIVLAMGLVRLFWETWRIMALSELKDAFSFTVTNLLTFFIILELFKSLVEYFREHRLRLTFIVDATLVFILREVMISLYQHQSPPLLITALAFLALVLGVLRTLAIVYSPMERKMVEHLVEKDQHSLRTEEKTMTGSAASSNLVAFQ
jgi:uncharacterized membrane protein (DUF373 family)